MVVFKNKVKVVNNVKVDMPKCDKLTVTLAIPSPSEQTDVLAAINSLISHTYGYKFFTRPYSLSAKVWLGKNAYESVLLVQAGPKKSNVSFLRFEFNPAKCDLSEIRSFIDWIVPNGGYQRLAQQGICTRVDVAIDVHNVAVDRLLVTHPGLQATRTFQKGGTGQTYELGSSQSARYFSIYDKRAQLKAHNSKAGLKQPVPQHPTTRIEARITDRTPMKALADLSNPFAALCVADFPQVEPTDELTRLFLATSRAYGAKAALQQLGPSRPKFTKWLEQASPTWWKPIEIWQAWQGEAGMLTKPPPAAFPLHLLKPKPYPEAPVESYA